MAIRAIRGGAHRVEEVWLKERSGGVIFPVHVDGRPDACRRTNVREPKGGKLADELINKSQFLRENRTRRIIMWSGQGGFRAVRRQLYLC